MNMTKSGRRKNKRTNKKKMGQLQIRGNSPRITYNENGDNGFVLCNKYIPEELLIELLGYMDYSSLVNCQIVCKKWKNLVQQYVWRRKAELVIGQSLQCIKDMPWTVYYEICKKNPFNRNLLKNHSGQDGGSWDKGWEITSQGGDHWTIENPPVGVPPLPDDPVFEGHRSCYATSYYTCTKRQIINLADVGLPSALMDALQPPIVVGEWYSARFDCPAKYECFIGLLDENNKIIKSYKFQDQLEGDDQNKWHRFTYEFRNYGAGVRRILFQDSGSDKLFWAGHYGSKMAGASVVVKLNSSEQSSSSSSSSSSANKQKSTVNMQP